MGSILLVASALFSFSLNKILYKYSRTLRAGNEESEDVVRWASTSKPTIGGISFFITFILASLVFYVTQDIGNTPVNEFLGLLVVATLGFFIGLQDDAYNTRPLLKFGGQVTCAVILIIFDIHIDLFGIPALDYFLTIFWVVGIMNSINLLDNMDGVTATVSITICTTTIVLMALFPGSPGLNPILFTVIALVGSFLGFLVLNWKPSKIYMGDTGSQFLGAFLAFIGIKFFWNIRAIDPSIDVSMSVIAPIMVFLVPLMDTSFVFIARISRGQSPFVGGKDHLTHHMNYLGVAEAWVPVLLGLVGLVSGFLMIFSVRYVAFWGISHTIVFGSYVVISFVIFYLLFKRGERLGYIKDRFSRTLNRHQQERSGVDSDEVSKERQHS